MYEAILKLSQEFLLTKNQRFRRYFIQKTKPDERFSILKGQRGIGKTTTMIQYLLDFAKSLFRGMVIFWWTTNFSLKLAGIKKVLVKFEITHQSMWLLMALK